MNNNRLPRLKYIEPQTVQDVLGVKKKYGKESLILAGGTDVVPMLKRRNISCRCIISIKKIPELKIISFDKNKGITIGAAVTLRELIDNKTISDVYPILSKAAGSVAYNQIRNMATLVGNICLDNKCTFFNQSKLWWQSRKDCFKRGGDRCYVVKRGNRCHALSAGDSVSALIALDAGLVIRGPSDTRRIAVEDFFTGDGRRPHHLQDDEFVTEVGIPPPVAGWRHGYLKKSLRGSVDFAVASMSLRLRSNGCVVEDMRIVLNGISTKPVRAQKTERRLIAEGLNAETIEASSGLLLKESAPISSIGAAVPLRKKMIAAMLEDIMGEIAGDAKLDKHKSKFP
jgi:4-hydroxybenzoyl-CoA reductase subunit beta